MSDTSEKKGIEGGQGSVVPRALVVYEDKKRDALECSSSGIGRDGVGAEGTEDEVGQVVRFLADESGGGDTWDDEGEDGE